MPSVGAGAALLRSSGWIRATTTQLQLVSGVTSIAPSAADGAGLGTASLPFSDLFLASGAVINFDNGDVTETHSADILTLAGSGLQRIERRLGSTFARLYLYDAFTDASNYSRLVIEANQSPQYNILSGAAGTGTVRNLVIGTDGNAFLRFFTNSANRWQISAAGHILADDDNTYDIGSATARPRTGYFGTSVRTYSANSAYAELTSANEAHTLAAAATSDTANLIPANSLVVGVTLRVTTTITGPTSFDVGVAGATTRYGTGIALSAGTTNVSPGTTNPTIYGSATAIRFTAVGGGGAFTAGAIRVTVHYFDLSAATS